MTDFDSITARAIAHFSAKLDFEIDPSDVAAAFDAGSPDFVLIDTRNEASWRQGRVPGAVHIPRAELAERAPLELPAGTELVVYCWGPGCNGATKSALLLSTLGYRVREMIGGFEYWAREGLTVESDDGHVHRDVDPLTAPVGAGISCDC